MKKVLFTIILITFFSTGILGGEVFKLSAQESGANPTGAIIVGKMPRNLSSGFVNLKKKDYNEAIKIWEDKASHPKKVRELGSYFKRLPKEFGDFKFVEVVSTVKLGGQTEVVYMILNYDYGAVFGRAVVFKWFNICSLVFSKMPEKVFPESMLVEK